jgi:hypothetical protein
MTNSEMKRAFLLIVALLAVTGAVLWWLRGVQQADPGYAPRVSSRTWTAGGPAVVIDDGHWNEHTAVRGFAPFAKLLTADGYTLIDHVDATAADALSSARVIVVANALGFRGVVRQVSQVVGLHFAGLAADAFSDRDADRLEKWVRDGGSLLLVADHTPAGRAMQSLADRFSITMHDGFVFDPEHAEPGEPSSVVFTREARTLGAHPIMDRDQNSVDRVVTFGGQALDGPAFATRLLMFSGTAYQVPHPSAGREDRASVAGLSQALAFEHGRGRVVVVGDAAVLTSQVKSGGGSTLRIGLSWPNSDNEQFARNIMRWLSRAG